MTPSQISQFLLATAGRRWGKRSHLPFFLGLQVVDGIPSGSREEGSCEKEVKLKRPGQDKTKDQGMVPK